MIVCVQCQAEMQVKKLGVTVIRTFGIPAVAMSIWRADLFGCPLCNRESLSRFGHEPVMESHEQGFKAELMKITPYKKYVVHSPELLVTNVRHETRNVKARNYGKN